MGHALDINEATGEARMFAVDRHPVWHKLGKRVREALTAEQAIKEAGLDWSVRKEPVGLFRIVDGKGTWVAQDDQFAVTRDEDDRVLGYVGKDYKPFQNWDGFSFLDSLVASGEAKYETAGSLFNGRRIWIMAKLPNHIEVAGGEQVERYLYCETSHDGSKATTVGISPVVIVCQNTLNMAIGRTKQSFSIRHTDSAQGKIQEARETLEIAFKKDDELKASVDTLVMTDVVDDVFAEILKTEMVWQPKATPRNIEAILTNRRESPTIRDEQRNTAWGAVQALTEFTQHHREYRTDESRMKASMGGWAQSLATKVTKDLLTLAGSR